MHALGRLLNRIANGAALLGALAIILMMLQIVADVVVKNIWTSPVPMTSTLVANWYMVAAAFLPLGMAELLDRHISVELVFQQLGRRWKRRIGGLACLFGCIVCLCMVRPLWFEALKRLDAQTFVVEAGKSLPVWQTYFFPVIGFAIFAAVLAYRCATLWSGARSGMGEVPIDEPPAATMPSTHGEGV